MLRKVILKPLSLGIESRLLRKLLLTLLHSNSLSFDPHALSISLYVVTIKVCSIMVCR